MATQPNSDTARVLKFTGPWEGRFEPTSLDAAANTNALADARLIINAKKAASDWTATLLLAMLATMDDDAKVRLELSLAVAADDSECVRQAMALVRLSHSSAGHKERVRTAVDALQGRRS